VELITEHRPVRGPVVYGFLRLPRRCCARRDALAAALAEYCRRHELLLSGMLTDHSGGTRSAAFTGLLDVLALPDTYGVVVPAPSHLGPKAMAAERESLIEAAGGRLLLLRGEVPPRVGADWRAAR